MKINRYESDMPDHFFIGYDGSLHNTRESGWPAKPLRKNYRWSHRNIETVADLKATLRNGPYAWPGGYPMFFYTSDGAALSFKSVEECYGDIIESIRCDLHDGWRVVGCDINYESEIYDDHSGELIESAYLDESDSSAHSDLQSDKGEGEE